MNRSSESIAGLIFTLGLGYLVYENASGPICTSLEKIIEVGRKKKQ